MIFFSESEIDKLLEDDAPMGDMTTHLLGLEGKTATIKMSAREDFVLSGIEETVRLYKKLDIKVFKFLPSGTKIAEGETFLEAEGDAAKVHLGWRTGSVMIEFASGIATRTRLLVDKAKKCNHDATVAGTRKHPPYLKKIALKALLAGGGVPHRTGVSDTILLFKEHLDFVGGYENLKEVISSIRKKQKERKIVVEAHDAKQAVFVCKARADAIQIDKMPVDLFQKCAQECKKINPDVIMIAAGGVNGKNVAEYARCGADVLVTSWMYFGPPSNIKVRIARK